MSETVAHKLLKVVRKMWLRATHQKQKHRQGPTTAGIGNRT
jgi:hypothetical protein